MPINSWICNVLFIISHILGKLIKIITKRSTLRPPNKVREMKISFSDLNGCVNRQIMNLVYYLHFWALIIFVLNLSFIGISVRLVGGLLEQFV